MERHLASIQRVIEKAPIYDRDGIPAHSIEQVSVLGWRLIAKRDEFQIGDLCVYFEIDSVLDPELFWVMEHASFMQTRGWRVKTLKLNNLYLDQNRLFPVISQGLALRTDILPVDDFQEGDDVTSILQVKKWERPLSDFGDMAGPFPDFISKTDEIRLQSAPWLIEELRGEPYRITLKYDGSSMTAWYDNGQLHVASRNHERKNDGNKFFSVAEKYKFEEVLATHPSMVLQGEVYGYGIQSNPHNVKGVEFVCFNVYDRDDMKYLSALDAFEFCVSNGIPHVEVLHEGLSFNYTLSQLEEMARGFYPNTNSPREGIVVRQSYNKYSKHLSGRISFKVINIDYLLKNKE